MRLSYVRGSWRFKVASLVANSVAVAVRYGNVGGSFSGSEELVASLMAECNGKKWGQPYFGGKGDGNFARQKLSPKSSNLILAAAEMSKSDGSFLGRRVCKHLEWQKRR